MFNHGHWKLKDFFKIVPPVSKVDNIHFILIQAKIMHFFSCILFHRIAAIHNIPVWPYNKSERSSDSGESLRLADSLSPAYTVKIIEDNFLRK